MKGKKLLALLLIMAVCCAAVFGILWSREKKDHSDLEFLCRYSAYRAYDRFSKLRDGDSDYDYRYGVAELTSFYNAYMNLVIANTDTTDTNCLYLNQLLGELMDATELTQERINELITISSMLSEDIYDESAFQRIFSLYNELSR